jgi:VanZ family protein
MRNVLPFALFLLVLGLWSWKLLEPSPVPERVAGEIPTDAKFILAKTAHAGAYALLTVLAAWLPIRRSYFWVVVATLAAHGIATEVGQWYVPNRHGSARDVLIDWGGIGLGLLALTYLAPTGKLRRGANDSAPG